MGFAFSATACTDIFNVKMLNVYVYLSLTLFSASAIYNTARSPAFGPKELSTHRICILSALFLRCSDKRRDYCHSDK